MSAHKVRHAPARDQGHREVSHAVRKSAQPSSGAGISSYNNPDLKTPFNDGSGVQKLLRVLPLASDEAPKVGPG